MTIQEIKNIPTEIFEESVWKPLINLFWDRYNKRYFNQIAILQEHKDFEIRNNCGFLIATIDCILIETLEQFYSGEDESKGKNHEPFISFFNRSKAFNQVIKEEGDAGKFAGLIRSGLIHQSKTKKASIINKQSSTPILGWINKNEKHKGFKLNRDKFHSCVVKEYENLIDNLKVDGNAGLREKFKAKMLTIEELKT